MLRQLQATVRGFGTQQNGRNGHGPDCYRETAAIGAVFLFMHHYGQKTGDHRVTVSAGKDYVLAYTFSGEEFLLRLLDGSPQWGDEGHLGQGGMDDQHIPQEVTGNADFTGFLRRSGQKESAP